MSVFLLTSLSYAVCIFIFLLDARFHHFQVCGRCCTNFLFWTHQPSYIGERSGLQIDQSDTIQCTTVHRMSTMPCCFSTCRLRPDIVLLFLSKVVIYLYMSPLLQMKGFAPFTVNTREEPDVRL